MRIATTSRQIFSLLTALSLIFSLPLAVHAARTAPVSAETIRVPENPVQRLLPVQVDGKWGYIDRTGTIVIKPQFDSADDFHDGRAFVRYPNREKPLKPGQTTPELIAGAGFIDETGKVVIELESPLYLGGDGFSEGLTKFWTWESGKGNLYGCIDTSGKVVVKPRFTQLYPFVDGVSAACIDRKCGFIDRTGEFVIAPKYIVSDSFSDGMALVGFDHNTVGFVNRSGELVIAPQFGHMGGIVFREGLASVAYPWGKYGYIDKQGVIVIPMQFQFAQPFSGGLAAVCVNDKWGYIDNTGKFVIEPQFRGAGSFSEGLAPVGANLGAVGIDPAELQNEPATGYIDKSGKMVLTLPFEHASSFVNGIAKVYADHNKLGYIDKTGNYIWKPTK